MADFRQYSSLYPNEASLKNNNPAGISYFGDNTFTKLLTDKGIKWSPGTSRPAAEGAKYLSFDTVEDGMKAYNELWNTKKYQDLSVADALKRWGTGTVGSKLDTNKRVSQLTQDERTSLQLAQLAKESPGFLKEMKKAGLISEKKQEKGFLQNVAEFFLPKASAESNETNYQFNMKNNDNSPAFSAGFTIPKTGEFERGNVESIGSYIDQNGGIGQREKKVFQNLVGKGMDKTEALYQVAKMKKYFIENPTKGATFFEKANQFRAAASSGGMSSGEQTTPEEQAIQAQASETGRFGIPNQSIDWAGRPEVAPEALESAKQSILSSEGGYESFANSLKGMTREQKAAIPGEQRQAFLSILKDKYDKFANAGPNGEATPEAQAAFAKWAKEAMYDLAPVHADAIDYQSQVFGYGASQDEKIQSDSIIADIANFGIDKLAGIAKTANTAANAIGINPFRMTAEAGQDVAEGAMEGNAFKAGSGIMKAVGVQQALSSPIGAAVTAGINQLAKTDAGSGLLKFALWAPSKGAEMLINAIPGIPEKQKADAIALARDVMASMAIRGTVGAYGGAKAGYSSSPAATAASKVGSALKTGAYTGIKEGLAGILDPFKVALPSSKVSAKSSKVINDAATRVTSTAENAMKMGGAAQDIGSAAIVDSAVALNNLKKLGVVVNDASELMDATTTGLDKVFDSSKSYLSSKKIPFDVDQLADGVAQQVEKSIGTKLTSQAQKSVNEAVQQIKGNIADSSGNIVANMDKIHSIASSLYETIIGSMKGEKFKSVDAPEVYLAAKEILYKQLIEQSKKDVANGVDGAVEFSKYLEQYRQLSRLKDVANLVQKRYGSDIMNKSFNELVPSSWVGIMAGSAASGNGWITASAALAALSNYAKGLKKSPTKLFNDIKKISDAMEKAGDPDGTALKGKLGIQSEPVLGQDAIDITTLPSSAQRKAAKEASENANMNSKFPSQEPGIDVDKFQAPSKSFMEQQFEAMRPKPMKEPGTPVETTYSPSKAEVEAALNPKPVTAQKKALAKKAVEAPKKHATAPKASSTVKKPVVAPKAKEVAKKAIPAKKPKSVEDYVKSVKLSKEVGAQLKEYVETLAGYDLKEMNKKVAQVAKIGTKELAGLLQFATPRTGLYKALSDALSAKLKK